MKLLVFIIFVLIAVSFPQEETKLFAVDSVMTDSFLGKLLYQFEEFDFYRELTEQKKAFIINNETSKLWLKVSMDISTEASFRTKNDLTPVYLHSSLYEQYRENSKFNPFRTALGLIQAGAVGYLAYKHIKKYVIKK